MYRNSWFECKKQWNESGHPLHTLLTFYTFKSLDVNIVQKCQKCQISFENEYLELEHCSIGVLLKYLEL